MSAPLVYLVDGSNYVFRAYHAIRGLSTSYGLPTNAVYGFVQMLFKLVKDYSPPYLAVVFDAEGKTFREEIYPEYKANRGAPPEDLSVQFKEIVKILDELGVARLEMEGYEADDVMGTIARRVEHEGGRVVLVTGDKDFCQLVSPQVTLLDTMRYRETDVEGVVKRFGVPPERVVDVLALTGDPSDNIPGVRGIGEKTAARLIGEWGSLEGLLENLDRLPTRLRKLIEPERERLLLYRDLVTIRCDLPIEVDLEALRFRPFEKERLRRIFERYEFRSLLRELGPPEEGGGAGDGGGVGGLKRGGGVVDYDAYELVTDSRALARVVEAIRASGEVSIDLETTSRHPMWAEIVGVALAPREGEACYVPLGHVGDDGEEVGGQLAPEEVLGALRGVLEDESIRKWGQNLKYEVVVLARRGVELRGLYCDAMLAAHLLDAARGSYSLDALSAEYLGHEPISYADVTGRGRARVGFERVGVDEAMLYAAEDADVALRVGKVLLRRVCEAGLAESFHRYEMPFVEVLASMEMAGVKVDRAKLLELSEEFERKLEELGAEIRREAGVDFNINSTPQLRDVLYRRLGLGIKKYTQRGEPSTDSEVLSELAKHHPVPGLVLTYRRLAKLKSTYIDALPRLIHPETGRIHSSFNQVGAATGRLSSSDPNLQNIPVKTAEGRRIREAFVAEEGRRLLSADYSQIELRLLAHFSEDEALIAAFENDEDIHAATAREIFGLAAGGEVTAEMRRLAKSVNFGIVYGISPYGLARQLGTTPRVAKQYMDRYFERYPGVKRYMERAVREAVDKGYAETLLGRRRPIKEVRSRNRALRGAGERAAINTPIQGSAADTIKIAMIRVWRRLREEGLESMMILQVHDELLFEVPEEELEVVRAMVRREMEGAVELRVPLKVEIGVGRNWAEAY